jgi:RHS repeat-associated protein
VGGTIYYDGATSPLNVNEDRLALDGMRLVKSTRSAWETERGATQVERPGKDTFRARYANGNVGTFTADPKESPFCYPLTEMTNYAGGSIRYTYFYRGSLAHVSKVEYGKSDKDDRYINAVRFIYDDDRTPIIRYADGRQVEETERLREIEVTHAGELWRRYLLEYADVGTILLRSVDCLSPDGHRLRPLKMWYDGTRRSAQGTFSAKDTQLRNFYKEGEAGDKDKDGYTGFLLSRGRFSREAKSDGLVVYPRRNTHKLVMGDDGIPYFYSGYAADEKLLVYKDLSDTKSSPATLEAGRGFQLLAAADVDGTGVDALVKVNYTFRMPSPTGKSKGKTGPIVTVNVYRDVNRLTDFQTYEFNELAPLGSKEVPELFQREFLLGDFNGDGKTELLFVSSCREHLDPNERFDSQFHMISLENGASLHERSGFDYTFFQTTSFNESPDRLVPMDYNGDGKTDLCLINKLGTYVYEFKGNLFRQLAHSWGPQSSTFNKGDQELMVADMNGDGNMDLVLAPAYAKTWGKDTHYDRPCEGACKNEANLVSDDGAYRLYRTPSGDECRVASENRDGRLNWRTYLSKGVSEPARDNDGFVTTVSRLVPGSASVKGQNFMLMDVDGDGLPDLLRRYGSRMELYLNRDGRIDPTPQSAATVTLGGGFGAQLVPVNIRHPLRGQSSLACLDNGVLRSYRYSRDEGANRLLISMVDSKGVMTEYNYADIATSDGNYEPSATLGAGLRYPYVVARPRLHVTTKMEAFTDEEDLRHEVYTYANAVFHRTGLGFRGFQRVAMKDLYNPLRTSTSIFDPIPGTETSMETPTTNVERRYRLDVKADKRSTLLLEEERTLNKLDGTTIAKTYAYDEYGYPTLEKSVYLAKGTIALTTEKRVTYRSQQIPVYLLGQPLNVTTTATRGDSTLVGSRAFSYRARAPLPYMEVETTNGDHVKATVTREYDACWRMTSETTLPFGSKEGTTTGYVYDTWGRKKGETDAMGRTTRYAYDQESGLLLSATDHKGRVTAYEYDRWGNLVATRLPDGSEKRVTTAWTNKAAGEPGLYAVTTSETDKPITRVYYDEFGQETRTLRQRMNGCWLQTDKKYRYMGNLLVKESRPVTHEDPSKWTIYGYDEYNRPVTARYPGGKVDSIAYAPLRQETFRNGVRQERRLDAAGMVTEASDDGGTIKYSYRPDGQLSLMEAPGGVTTRFQYDAFGRRVTMVDPSAGTRRTVYDDRGNIAREIDADGRETSWEYDRYGRVIRRVTPELETVYAYADGENALASAVSTGGMATYYAYDDLGRPVSVREEAPDGKWLVKEYTYGAVGSAPASIKYSTQDGPLATERYRYLNGYLHEVTLEDGTLVYRVDDENEEGQLSALATGDMTRYYEYDEAGLPARRRTIGFGRTIFDQGYVFDDATGNLRSRTDNLRGLTERFGYDAMNRLTAYGNHAVEYAANGNIASRGDTGTQGYGDPSMPYATTELNPATAEVEVPEISVDYVAGDRPSAITKGSDRVTLAYDENGDRVRMSSPSLTRYYLGGNYELDEDSLGRTRERLYLGGGYYDAPAVLVKEGGQAAVYYIHRDYLGSVLQITDARGDVVEENNFAPYGRRRDPATLAYYPAGQAPPLMLGRGFTGHEHLPRFGLVNMNARLYDPVLGRFLSPDPYVQLPYSTLGVNRYAYAMNNPLCYVDENGESVLFIIGGILIGGYVGASVYSGTFNPARWKADWWKGALIGGAIGGGVGTLVGAMWASGASVSLGVSGSSLYVPVVTFTPATSTAGGMTTLGIGTGFGIWSGVTVPLGGGDKQGDESLFGTYGQGTQSTQTDPFNLNYLQTKAAADKDPDDGPFGATDILGYTFSGASSAVYNETAGRWMGKNGKFYNFNFNGNQYTGGRVKFAKNLSTKLGYVAKGLGYFSLATDAYNGFTGKTSAIQTLMDMGFDAAAIWCGPWGIWTNIWYNLGKEYGPIHLYMEYKNRQKY